MTANLFRGNSRPRHLAAIFVLAIIAIFLGAPVTLHAQDLAGEWVSMSPLGIFVQDDSQQPVNTFVIEKIETYVFNVKYLGSKATGFTMKFTGSQFEGLMNNDRGKASFVLSQTRDQNIWNCEIKADYPLNSDVFVHKDIWKRVGGKQKAGQFLESAGIIMTETKEGLVAYNKRKGTWARIEVAAPVNGMSLLSITSLSEDFAATIVNGELLGYSNQASRWSRMRIPPELAQTTNIRYSGNSVTATVGNKLYVLSLATGKWESPDEAQNSAQQAGLGVETVDDLQSAPQSMIPTLEAQYRKSLERSSEASKADFETEILNAAQRFREARNKNGDDRWEVADARKELERAVEQALDQKLKEEQSRIAELKNRIALLEKQLQQRLENRSSVIHRRVDELMDSIEKATQEVSPREVKSTLPQPPQTAILRYEDSAELTAENKTTVEAVLRPYVERLKNLGFKLENGQVVLRVQPGMATAHYYHNTLSIVTDPSELTSERTVRREYTHHALAVALGEDAKNIFDQCPGIESGLADYFGCSACNDPAARGNTSGTIDNQLSFANVPETTHRHAYGEIVGGTLWEMRRVIGRRDNLDYLLYKAWVGIAKTDPSQGQLIRFVTSLLNVVQKENPGFEKQIRTVLERRGVKLDSIVSKLGPVLRYEETEELTKEMIGNAEDTLIHYAEHLKRLGFHLENGQVALRLQKGMSNAHYYHNTLSIVMDPLVVGDQSVMRREYNHHALAVVLDGNSKVILENCSGIESGIADYLGCSYSDDPIVGAKFATVLHRGEFLRTMESAKNFADVNDNSERHDLGEAVSGTLWKIREVIGKEVLDPLVCKAWAALPKTDQAKGQILRFTTTLLEMAQREIPDQAKQIRAIFEARGLKLR